MAVKVVITGASGLLGTAIRKAFTQTSDGEYEVLSLAFSRSHDSGLVSLDITKKDEVERVFRQFQPAWVIHCAAERRPDAAEKDPVGTGILNVEVPRNLAWLAKSLGFTLVYISTDYVFDGKTPPYAPTAVTNPLQAYGKTKRDGELEVLKAGKDDASVVVLRVPVLYGPAAKNTDSAINILIDVVGDQSGKTYKMDHWAQRYPTNVGDIANFLVRLSAYKELIPPSRILHYSGDERFTKYDICLKFAEILGLPHHHIIADDRPPSDVDATKRPRDCRLDTTDTAVLLGGGDNPLALSKFEEWWSTYLKGGEFSSVTVG